MSAEEVVGASVPTTISLSVSHHAMWRAKERFPDFDTVEIEGEVWAAFAAGRVSSERPPGMKWEADPNSLHAWTEDGLRVYALKLSRYDSFAFVVTTTFKADR